MSILVIDHQHDPPLALEGQRNGCWVNTNWYYRFRSSWIG